MRNSLAAFSLFFSSVSFAAPQKLNVYTYSAFTSEWGPGAAIRAGFEKECACELHFVAVDDGATLLKRIKLEGAKTRADVALGFDSNMAAEVMESDLFAKADVEFKAAVVAPMDNAYKGVLVPFDFSWLAVMYDSEKISTPPKDMNDLLTRPEFSKKLLIQRSAHQRARAGIFSVVERNLWRELDIKTSAVAEAGAYGVARLDRSLRAFHERRSSSRGELYY